MPREGHKPKWDLEMSPEEWYQEEDPWGVSEKEEEWEKAYFILDIIPNAESGLDLGCGEGVFTKLYKRKIKNLSACDISPTAIERAKENVDGVNFFVQDMTQKFDMKERFDMVLINEVLYYINPKKWKQMSENIYGLLKPKGKLLVTCGQYFEIGDIEEMFPQIHFNNFYKKGSWFTMVGGFK